MEDGLAGKKRRIAELKASLAAKLSELEEALETSLADTAAEVSALRSKKNSVGAPTQASGAAIPVEASSPVAPKPADAAVPAVAAHVAQKPAAVAAGAAVKAQAAAPAALPRAPAAAAPPPARAAAPLSGDSRLTKAAPSTAGAAAAAPPASGGSAAAAAIRGAQPAPSKGKASQPVKGVVPPAPSKAPAAPAPSKAPAAPTAASAPAAAAATSAAAASAPKGSGAGGAGGRPPEEGTPIAGNVDYCDRCDDEGDLYSCSRCPRSFHLECLRVRSVPDVGWRCPVCVRTFGAHGEHETEAGAFTGPVATRLFPGPFRAPKARRATVQAELLDVVEQLREHEFAPNFLYPVDAAAVPGYAAAVKLPRDLGTIRKALRAGLYGAGPAFDAVRVIADLRLVFHNCRWFNRPLSTIWRMADVLSRELETALRDRVSLSAAQAERLEALRVAELSAAALWKA